MTDYRIIFSSPAWSLSGVNTASANIIRELVKMGADARFLLTRPEEDHGMPMPAPGDIPTDILAVKRRAGIRARRWAVIEYLESMAPCVYIPGYDWEHSAVSPVLSPQVVVAGVVHSDDPVHYEHVKRLGKYWNVIICVSREVEKNTVKIDDSFRPRTCMIPSGVIVPPGQDNRRPPTGPLKIIYTGRIIQHQKRIMDLAPIVEGLKNEGVDFRLSILGGGPEFDALKMALDAPIKENIVRMTGTVSNATVLEELQSHHAFLLVSDFEGTPVSLLEAMAAGCAPVVTDIPSGIPELVIDGKSGFLVAPGDVNGFVRRLKELAKDRGMLEKTSENARAAIKNSPYAVQNVAARYLEEFDKAFGDLKHGRYRRPKGKICPPPRADNGFIRSALNSIMKMVKN